MPIKARVEGISASTKALDAVGAFNIDEAANNAAGAILETLRGNSRVATGAMAGGWNVDGPGFMNSVPWVSYQEFGTVFVTPQNALQRTWAQEAETVQDEFAKVIVDAGTKAGLDA
jgi:hypothetical protein